MKIKYLIIIAIVMFIPQIVYASPTASISVNANYIERGKTVTATVTVNDTAAWNLRITGSGAATCSTKVADVTADGKSTTKKFSLACTSTVEGTINFSVTGDITSGTGESRDISLTKAVTVTKPKSSDNSLSALSIDGALVPGFNSGTTSYTLNKKYGANVNITATPNDSKAKVSGTGTKALNYGSNTVSITVTAENGSQKTYTLYISREDTRSSNNNLKSLSISSGNISFNKDTTEYVVVLEHNINEINIIAVADDSKALITGAGKKTLVDYSNEFNIEVTAENTSKKIYKIRVDRKDSDGNSRILSDDSSVNSITIKDYDFNFNKDIKKYNILVEENINNLEINVVPNDQNAKVEIINNTKLKTGLNKVNVKVVSEKGSINEYLFNVYKIGKEEKKESNNNILWIIISGIEFIVILVLSFMLLKKKKYTNENTEINLEINMKN